MRILENRKIRRLFLWVLAAVAAFALLSAAAVLCLKPKAAAAFLALGRAACAVRGFRRSVAVFSGAEQDA